MRGSAVNPRIYVLTLCTFAFGSAAFIFAGLIEPMAADLGVSTAVAGQLQDRVAGEQVAEALPVPGEQLLPTGGPLK